MRFDMRLVILNLISLGRLHVRQVHVLRDGIQQRGIILFGDDLLHILDAKDFQHLSMQLGQVVELRRLGGELDCSLILHHSLRHGGRIRIGDRDHVNAVVEVRPLAPLNRSEINLVAIRSAVANDANQDRELILKRCVESGLDSRHHLHRPFHDGKRCAYRRLRIDISNLSISNRSETTTILHHISKKLEQRLRRLLVWQRIQRPRNVPIRDINIAPLSRLNRGVIPSNTQTLRLQAAGKIRQRAAVNQLAQDRSRRLCVPADQVDEAVPIRTHAGYIVVRREPDQLVLLWIALIPVLVD